MQSNRFISFVLVVKNRNKKNKKNKRIGNKTTFTVCIEISHNVYAADRSVIYKKKTVVPFCVFKKRVRLYR